MKKPYKKPTMKILHFEKDDNFSLNNSTICDSKNNNDSIYENLVNDNKHKLITIK
ncbi:MAG: hypothetical protein ACI4PU_01675 [Intestinibacter sp.]